MLKSFTSRGRINVGNLCEFLETIANDDVLAAFVAVVISLLHDHRRFAIVACSPRIRSALRISSVETLLELLVHSIVDGFRTVPDILIFIVEFQFGSFTGNVHSML